MLLSEAFNKKAYIIDGRLNLSFMHAVLNSLSLSQHLYDRKDLAELYHFIGNLFDHGEFGWAGTNHLTKQEESAIIQPEKTRSEQSPSSETTQPSAEKQAAKTVSTRKASKTTEE